MALLGLLLSGNLQAADGLATADSLYRAGRYDAAVSILEKDVVPELEAQHDTLSLVKAWSILGCIHLRHHNGRKHCRIIPDYCYVNYG